MSARLRTLEIVPSERVPSTAHHIARICHVHFPDCLTAQDTTPGVRRFWSETVATGLSVSFSESDIRDLPYADASFDLGIVDLPHLADLGANSILAACYGTLKNPELEPLVRAGVAETWRICRIGVLIKVTDHCHAQRYQDESAWVQETLGHPYTRVHAIHVPIGRRSWPQLSTDSNGSTYLIFRRGSQLHTRRGWQKRLMTPLREEISHARQPTGGEDHICSAGVTRRHASV
jgi:hypothetical protein